MEPQRHYHTLVHLDELLAHFHGFENFLARNQKEAFSDRDSILFTLFFHDVVYDPRAKDNEEQSAALFAEFAKQALADSLIDKVVSYILQTKTHMNVLASAPLELLGFLDMDLAILGAPKERYIRYADEIRAEYKHIPHDLFCKGRSAVLKSFLGQRLYKTTYFYEKLEQRARMNIQWEIMRLRSPELSACRLTITDTPELKKLEASLRRDSLKLNDVDVTYCAVVNMDLSLCYKDRADRIISYILTTVVEDENVGYSLQQRELHEPCGSHLLLHSLVTVPDQRHRGLAMALVNHIITLAAERHMTRITTWCPKDVAGLFLALGFTQLREVPEVPCTVSSAASDTRNSSVTVEVSLNLLGLKL
jgi:predicted metal-dependent HD superfamily phosphohydrolase/GNAT superfamily N-acetyltransferase